MFPKFYRVNLNSPPKDKNAILVSESRLKISLSLFASYLVLLVIAHDLKWFIQAIQRHGGISHTGTELMVSICVFIVSISYTCSVLGMFDQSLNASQVAKLIKISKDDHTVLSYLKAVADLGRMPTKAEYNVIVSSQEKFINDEFMDYFKPKSSIAEHQPVQSLDLNNGNVRNQENT